MLDVITDFWKPVKKAEPQEKPDVDAIAVGSSITFATVPQAALSGKTLKVSAVNTYQFSEERLTSFVLANEREDSLSLIIARADSEPYLAISRRIPFAERMKIFDPFELETVIDQADATQLVSREVEAGWKHWIVPRYKKEISELKGSFARGDLRQSANGAPSQNFDYTLLTSDNNEHAVEIEKYADGRIEIYATIYCRLSDIARLENPSDAPAKLSPILEAPVRKEPVVIPPAAEKGSPAAKTEKPAVSSEPKKEPELKKEPVAATPSKPAQAQSTPKPIKEKETMPFVTTNAQAPNGAANESDALKSRFGATMLSNGTENDAIECDLRIANKIIEEAIRNEMRLSDVVRRVIALPVANPDSVQIPITLTDNDFQLLAIRYGISASDRAAIKTRIIEELGDFSGKKQ